MERCLWCKDDPLNMAYHDTEWGVPCYDDKLLFEFLVLETMQAGLSWITVLRKRENYRQAFDNFEATKIAGYTDAKIQSLLTNAGIIRNRLKIAATIHNANIFLQLQADQGSFSDYLWRFVEGQPLRNAWQVQSEIPTRTAISDKLSSSLKQLGFKFVGTTVCYAYMQAIGLVNDHLFNCFRSKQLNRS